MLLHTFFRFRVSVRNRFGLSDPSPYCVAHRSQFADEEASRPREMFLEDGEKFDLSKSKRLEVKISFIGIWYCVDGFM